MNIQTYGRLLALGLLVLLLASIISASATANTIVLSGLSDSSRAASVNDLKPAACGGQHLTNLIAGSGNISGTLDNDLILGSAGADTIDGDGGDDCSIGGGGADVLMGGPGTDTCIGGPGTDTIEASCEHYDPERIVPAA